jgi:hypothetical protein
MRRLVNIALGAAWVVGVYIGLKHLPAGVHHFFYERCWRVGEDEGRPIERCAHGELGSLKSTLTLALWIGLEVAPFVIVHYFRKWRTEVERRARQEGELAGMMHAETEARQRREEAELADLLSDD